ncbi:tetratricopeptide repeat protein [Chamaesiphon sp. VAR_48_metabat_135_sub]|uniref:tetratricopeptide repeat protein n=1 Tax=Chamaesiphon sp. VAR_48_metabat_135_sub TaxID=2964699 RepID=UPI00286A9BA8|nr:tetratricopeptide repeat protein [Chamaesiphon sp. VAR_48_metabat_135_sub]
MSKPYSPSSAPEFATQHDYSDILGISTPPAQTLKSNPAKPSPSSFEDPWANDISADLPNNHSTPAESKIVDPWASDTSTNAPAQSTAQRSPVNAPAVRQEATSSSATQSRNPPIETRDRPPANRPQSAVIVDPPVSAKPEHPAESSPKVESSARVAAPVIQDGPSVTAKDLALQYYKSGNKSLAAKDYAKARSAYKIAIEWNPQLASAHRGIAQVCEQIQDYEGALVAWDLTIQCDSTQIDFYYQRALVQKVLKNYYQVLADCKRILEHSPHHPSARWLNAVALVKVEHYQIALLSLNQHLETYPQDPNGYCYRGICYERLEKFPEALADFDRAIALQSRQHVFHHARGRTRQKLGDLKGALADFNVTIDLKPRAAVYDDRSEIHRCLGNHLEALQDCDRAIELNPKFIDAHFRRGLTYAELGDLQLALVNYTSTIDLDPHHINAWTQRSWIYFRQKDYPRAKLDCQAVNAFGKSYFWSNYILGVVNSLLGLKNNAIANFSKAIEISPNYVSARYHRGIVYHELGDIPKAMKDFEQARTIQDRGLERLVDRDETGFYAEGLALHYLGQSEAARTVLLLGALSAKRFNNPSFHQLILSNIQALGLSSGDLDP